MVSWKRETLIWLLWLTFWPLILWFSYNHYYLHIENQLIDILLFGAIMILVALFPLKVNNYQVFFTNGISIVVFLMFGLFAEIILTQIVVVTVLLSAGVGFSESFRFPLNMLSISIVSLLSANIFYLFGGTHGGANYESSVQLLAAAIYGVSVVVFNTSINKVIDRFFYNREFTFFGKEEAWEFTSILLVLPVGYVLYILYVEIGTAGIFYLGVPFVFISIIIQLLYSYQELNNYLSKTSKIGHFLTKNLRTEEVYDIFMKELQDLIKTDYIRVFSEEKGRLKLERFFNQDLSMTSNLDTLEKYNSFSQRVWESRKPLIFRNGRKWKGVIQHKAYKDIQSVISLPIEYGEEVIGVVTVASKQKNHFEKFHMEILDILTSYLGVAIQNAKNLEKTKLESNLDGLTQIYNYRYFENVIESYEKKYMYTENIRHFSIILLDIDHFKQVNDTYGHEAGNEILQQLAARLVSVVDEEGLVARYGGEEFAVFLPKHNSEKAYFLAKRIQNEVKNRKFVSYNHILTDRNPIDVSITISMGVATYPNHCESLVELIRHADRAMYVGAKNKGRDRIAVYEEIL